MRVPFQSELLGPLEVVEVFMRHDVPRLFSCKSPAGFHYLAQWADELEQEDDGQDADVWLVVPVSPHRLEEVRVGRVGLQAAFREAEGGRGVLITAQLGRDAQIQERHVELADLDDDLFHAEGVALQRTPAPRTEVELEVTAAATAVGQTVANVVFDHGRRLALGAASSLFASFTQVLERLSGPAGRPHFALSAAWDGSLGIQISGANDQPTFFESDTPEKAALDALARLFEANYAQVDLEDVIQEIGATAPRYLQKSFVSLVQSLSLANADMDFEWSAPRGTKKAVSLNRKQIRFMYAGIKTHAPAEERSEQIDVEGILRSYNKAKRRISIDSARGRMSWISYAGNELAESQGFQTEATYRFSILEEASADDEGEPVVKRSLISYEVIDELPPSNSDLDRRTSPDADDPAAPPANEE